MKVIAIASQKGGAGKSTLAAHMAVLASNDRPALLIDTDPQGSLAAWWQQREGETPLLIEGQVKDLGAYMDAARSENTPCVIIDCPPHREAGIAEAMRAADLIVVPVRPSFYDLQAIESTLEMATTLNKPALVVLNACPAPRGYGEPVTVREARDYLINIDAPVARAFISDRAAFRHALIEGLSVVEMEPDGKAAKETTALWSEIKQTMGV